MTPLPQIGQTLDPLPHRPRTPKVKIWQVQQAVAKHFGLKVSDLTSERMGRRESRPRQIAYYLSRELTSRSYPVIGRAFGNRDHSTVIRGIKQVDKWMHDPRSYPAEVAALFLIAQELEGA